MQQIACAWAIRTKMAMIVAVLLMALVFGGRRAEAAEPVTRGSAYGEQLSLKVQTLLATVQASSGPLSSVSGDTPPFNKDASALSINVGLGPYGTVLHTGLLLSHTDSPSAGQVSSNATVHDLGISLLPVAPLLTLHTDEVRSSAVIGGTCGSALTATGSTTLVNAGVGGTLGLGLHIGASVAPNTVLLDLLGIRVVLNEQLVGGDGVTSRSISVNAIHISIQNALLSPIARLTGNIVIAHSEAQVVCAPPPAPKADLGVTLTAAPNPVEVGQVLTYTLNVANSGPSTATSVVLSDVLPAGVTLVSAQPSQGSCGGTATISCSLGTLALGGNASVVIRVIPNTAGSLTDTASVTGSVPDPNLANNNASVTVNAITVPAPKADVGVTLTAAPNPVEVGQVLTYTLNVASSGPSTATGVVLSDVLPAGVTLVSAQPSQGSCGGMATISCSLGTLALGGNASVVIQVIPNTAGSLTDTASVASGVPDPNTANNNASVTVNAIIVPGPEADLSITLAAAPNPVEVGQILTYTLNVTNSGPSTATGVVLSDVLPAGVTLVSAQPSQGSCGGTATISCSLGTLAIGGNASVVIQVIPNTAGSLTDTASVASGVPDPNPTNNNASATVNAIIVPGPEADLSITLAAAPDPVEVGQILTYTLNVSNSGPSDATGVLLSDVLPAGVTLVSAQPTQGSCSGTATISCSLGTLAAGGNASVVIQVIPNTAGSLTDTASVASGVPDPNPTNNNASVTVNAIIVPGPEADLSITLAAAPDPVEVGQILTYTLNVSNSGPSDATGVLLSDVLPAGVTLVSAQPTQGSCSGTATISCSLGMLAVGGNATVVIQVIPNTTGSLTDTAIVTSGVPDPNAANNNASITVNAIIVPGPEADLSIALAAAPNPVEVGQILTYTLNVSNSGPSDATGVLLSEVLPGGVTLVSVQPTQGSCAGTATISCSLGTLAAGGNATVVIQVIPNAAGNITDTANVTGGVDDPDTANNDAAVTVTVINLPGEADLALSLGADPDPVEAGQTLTYFVNVSNFGPSDAIGVVLSDVLPAGVSLVSVSPSQGSCAGTTTISCALGTVVAGADAFVEIQVVPNMPGSLTDTASVTSGVHDPDTSNNDASVTVTVPGPAADLALTLVANPHPVLVGQVLTYTLNVSNSGPSDAPGVELSDVLPAGVTLVSVLPSQGTCAGITTISCSLGTVAVGGDASVVIQVLPNQAGNITGTASVTGSLSDPDLTNNNASVTVIVYTGLEPRADLSIIKRATAVQVSVGATFTYELTINNGGPDDATGVVVTDPLPAGLTLLSATSTQGDCGGTDTITCNLGALANGAAAMVTITVQADNTGQLVNEASVTAETADLDDSNNHDTATVTVRPPS
jgi:uncharacterized repeat protein (TIGR01451 family)